MMAVMGFLYVAFVHYALKREYEMEQEEMDNSEYDYGHDVHYTTDDHLF